MTLVTLPTGGIRSVDWTLPEAATFVVRSGWSGQQTVGNLGGIRAGWKAKVTIAPRSQSQILDWRTWMATMLGVANTFEIDAADGTQLGAPTSVVGFISSGAPYGSMTATTPNGLILPAGSLFSLVGRLYVLTSQMFGVSGSAGFTFYPQLPSIPTYASALYLQRPVGTMRLSNPQLGWSVAPGRVYVPFSFDCEEAL